MIDLLDKISKITNISFRIDKKISDMHYGGTKLRCPKIDKIQSLGYKCKFDLKSGLKITANWYKANFKEMLANVNEKF